MPAGSSIRCNGRGQVEGGVRQSLGATLYEEMVIDQGGRVVKPQNSATIICRPLPDIPRTEVYFGGYLRHRRANGCEIDERKPLQSGGRSLGNALADATGIRFTATPFKPDRLWAAAA